MGPQSIRSSLLSATALCGLVLCCIAVQAPILADAPAADQGATADRPEKLEEVIVTATRRETNLQSTPIAVTALDNEFMAQMAPRDISDLAAFVPNFSASKITGFNAASFAMRGVGQNNIIVYYDSPVVVLVDDFVVPSVQTQLLDTFDLQNMEVLRGPQGTLFGKNATGGAVSVHTMEPDMNKYGGRIQVGGGSYGSWYAKGSADMPIIPGELALRLVVGHEADDGYYKDGACAGPIVSFVGGPWAGRKGCGSGNSIGGNDVTNGRAKLEWKPNDRFKALLQYEFVRDYTRVATVNSSTDKTFLAPVLGFNGYTGYTGNPLDAGAVSTRDSALLGGSKPLVQVDGAYLNMNYQLDFGTVTSVTGYRSQLSHLPSNYVGNPAISDAAGDTFSFFDANRSDLHETFEQEMRFASNFGGSFDFVAGAFFQDDRINFCVAQALGFEDLVGGPSPYGAWNDNPYILCNDQQSDSYAAYTEGTYKVTDRWSVTGGARYTIDRKTWEGRQQAFAQDIAQNRAFTYNNFGDLLDAANFTKYPWGVIRQNSHWAEPTYRFSTGYQLDDQVYGYFTYSHGYKAGGFNDQNGSFAPFGNNLTLFQAASRPTNPEFADSYEIGTKTQTFDDKLRANLTAFRVNYNDIQKQIVVPIAAPNGTTAEVTQFFNAAAMHVEGLEAELTALPMSGMTVRANVGYEYGQYDSYVTPIAAGYNLATSPIDRTPRWQYSLDVAYAMPVGDLGVMTFDTNLSYVDKNLFTQSITALGQNTYLDARYLLGASATFIDDRDRYYVKLIGRNLTDKTYNTASQVVAGLWAFSTYGAPRYVGGEVGMKF